MRFPIMAAGLAIVALGLGGSLYAVQSGLNDGGLLVAGVSGFALALGMTSLGFAAMRRGYHYRALGSPPGDMDATQAMPAAPARIRRD
jgi:hypothetical protein